MSEAELEDDGSIYDEEQAGDLVDPGEGVDSDEESASNSGSDEDSDESESILGELEDIPVDVAVPPPPKETFGLEPVKKIVRAHIIPRGREHTARRIDEKLLAQLLSMRVRDLESRGDDTGHLNPEEIEILPPGNRYHNVAMAEIMVKKCPYSAKKRVGVTKEGEPIYEVVPVNDMVMGEAPVWAHPDSL
jgi:hypothetical protein